MGVFTKGLILACFGLIILGSYLSATQGWGVASLHNPAIVKKSKAERDSLHRAGGGHTSVYHRSYGSTGTGLRSNRSTSRSTSGTRSFRGGSTGSRGK
jgi:hypothetical protein